MGHAVLIRGLVQPLSLARVAPVHGRARPCVFELNHMRAHGSVALDQRLTLVAFGDKPAQHVKGHSLVLHVQRLDEQSLVGLLDESVLGEAHILVSFCRNSDLPLAGHLDPLRRHASRLRHAFLLTKRLVPSFQASIAQGDPPAIDGSPKINAAIYLWLMRSAARSRYRARPLQRRERRRARSRSRARAASSPGP